MPDVFFYEAFKEESEAIRRLLPANITADLTWKTIQETTHTAPLAPVISIRTQSVIPPNWASQLSAVLTRSSGYDHLRRYLQLTGAQLACGYLPLYCNRAVAEQAILLWMALLRKLPQQVRHLSDFNRDGITGLECKGRRLLVVGVGNIGSEIIKLGRNLGMEVRGVDLVEKHDFVNYTSTEASLPWADIVVCAMSLTPQNKGYFNARLLRRAKPGVIFINIARGELSPSADLLELLDQGLLGGVGLDVYNHENELAVSLRLGRPSDDPEIAAALALARRDNAILTPHNAFNTAESVNRKADQSVKTIARFLEKREFIWNVPERETRPPRRPNTC